ncbi:MAG TPA: hypothetical protein VLH19_04155 [Patescibacteria group bacterium]|nr:hypothetical protein [Patescibacteria group bacterium]
MKKLFAALGVALSMVIAFSPSQVFAASSGPVGRNQTRVYPGPGVGQVTVEWQRYYGDGENFRIHYGTQPKTYQYATGQIGYISTYTVGALTPGLRYYFTVEGFRTGNVSAGWDGEVSTVAPSVPTTVVGTQGPVGRNLLRGTPGPMSGEITLNWKRFYPDTEAYSIVYGLQPGVYIYGAIDAVTTQPQTNNYSFTIRGLRSGTRYYAALQPRRSGGNRTYVTSEVSVVAR